MTLLALDLGTSTGFAYRPVGGVIISGTWRLKPSAHENELSRFARFRDHLTSLHVVDGLTRIWYELVARHIGTRAAHVYGGFQATLITWCEDNKVALEGVAVGTIKKAWTGKGDASKEAMIAEAVKRGFNPDDDNEADALALLFCQMVTA